MSEHETGTDERPEVVTDSGVGTPTGAPSPADIPSGAGDRVSGETRVDEEITGSDEGGAVSGGGGEAATTPLVGNNRRPGDDRS